MDAMRKRQLEQAGVQVDEAMERMMGSEALLLRLLGKFPADGNYQALCAAVAAGDRSGAFSAAHTLKGVCGNLSFTTLYQLLTEQVELLRGEDWEGACALMPQIDRAYAAVIAAIGVSG